MGKNSLIAAVLAGFAVCAPARALEIVSAEPIKTEQGKIGDFLFSGSVTVRGISFEKNAVVMPVTEYKDRTYTDVRILSKALYKKIEACFYKTKCAAKGNVSSPKVSLLSVSPLKSPVRIANVTLSFDGDLAVTFGALRRDSGELRTAYPSDFEVSDPAVRKLIDDKVAESAEKAAGGDKPEIPPADPKN